MKQNYFDTQFNGNKLNDPVVIMLPYRTNYNSKSFLITKMLEQGQRLRNSIVETILQNDPFNVNAILDPQVHVDNTLKNTENSVSSKQIDAYLQGKQMSVEEEQQVLYALQRMSPDELCKITDRIYTSYNKTCDCDICNMYTNDNLCCDLKRSATSLEQKTANVPPIDIKSKQFQDCCEETAKYLRYVDSMQVLIYSLWLNDAGKHKISASETKLPSMVNHSYFVEYSIPDSLAKVKPINSARFCSKTLHDNQIYFRQSSIHDIKTDCLCDTQLRFTVSCRTLKQKQSNVLGVAKFNLGLLEGCKNLACCQRLTLYLNEQSAVVMGSLKVTVKLGCGRLYFGKKFIDAISGNERPAENSLDSSDASQVEINTVKSTAKTISTTKAEDLDKSVQHRLPYDRIVKVRTKRIPDSSSQTNNLIQLEQVPKICTDVVEINKQIVWGLIYISQAQFLEKVDSYCTYQPFCIEESTCTKTVCNSSNPVYDHVQKVPLIYEDDLLYCMRDNFTVLEFWGRTDGKFTTIGLAKLPLQQFYLSYRNPIVLKHLLKNKLPVISTDWWEPIEGLNGEDAIIGQVHVLLALGSDRQIHNLEEERGFCKDIVKAQAKPIINKVSPFKKAVNKGVTKIRAVNSTVKSVEIQTEMESTSVESPKVPSQEKLENFLSQLLQIQKVSTTDTSTNTEVQQNENPVQEEPSEGGQNLRLQKTSDLLDTLQKALSIEPGTFEKTEDSFKAHILIENALHLPVRKKCRSKKSKTKNVKKNDDLLPTTYVTFEALPNQELKVTPIVKKNSSPRWDYHCDVSLPLDLLTNNQKRLIFKVWRKSNLSVLEPCPQTDIVLGFAALDLTVLSAGLPSVHGWFNIVDFTSKCHGQIKIQVTPLENITKYNQMKDLPPFDQTSATAVGNDLLAALPPLKTLDESSELLSRTLKRKFIELDEITQRLRLRLSDVTRDESDTSNDEVADEFERDINTLCVEDDYDMINLETETDNYNQQRDEGCGLLQLQENTEKASQTDNKRATGPKLSEQLSIVTENSLCTLDRHLVEGKQRIDTLLEKLTLMSGSDAGGTPSSRNGSGCSAMQDSTSNILKELGIESRPHINSESLYDPQMFRQIYTEDCTPSLLTSVSSGDCTSSDSSAVTMFSDCRRAPDGAGTSIDDK